jgi:hypothetical protein
LCNGRIRIVNSKVMSFMDYLVPRRNFLKFPSIHSSFFLIILIFLIFLIFLIILS